MIKLLTENVDGEFCDDGSVDITFNIKDHRQAIKLMDVFVKGSQYVIEIKRYFKGRSRNANNYAWVLIGKLADALGIDKDECHRNMLASYGQSALDSSGDVIIVQALNTIPIKDIQVQLGYVDPIKKCILEGHEYVQYRVLRGSRTFDRKEMSIYIDGIISECQMQEIETMTPGEKARLIAAWESIRGQDDEKK